MSLLERWYAPLVACPNCNQRVWLVLGRIDDVRGLARIHRGWYGKCANCDMPAIIQGGVARKPDWAKGPDEKHTGGVGALHPALQIKPNNDKPKRSPVAPDPDMKWRKR